LRLSHLHGGALATLSLAQLALGCGLVARLGVGLGARFGRGSQDGEALAGRLGPACLCAPGLVLRARG